MWKEYAEKICRKTLAACGRNKGRIPYTADAAGRFDDQSVKNISWWTNGFWAGQLWQVWSVTGEPELRGQAQLIEEKLDAALMDASGMDHDSGFKWLPTAGADYTLTKNPASLNRLLLAASNLAGRFNPRGRFIRAWNDATGERAGWAIIDCLMNLPLLYRASRLTNDPRFAEIAALHARTAAESFVRPDGSVDHIVAFDPDTGKRMRALGGQGMCEGSSWSRGQAWAIYGFALSYIYTREPVFLDCAVRCAGYFLRNISPDGTVRADFAQPEGCDMEDGSAAAIAACGLLALFEITGDERQRDGAARLLETLAQSRCDLSTDTDSMVTRCTVSFHGEAHDHPLIYADYFFTEAVLRLAGKGVPVW